MKRSYGITLIEVVIALAITAILLPVLGLVFYQVLTIPPEQSSLITLTNDVGRLSSMLYRDGYMADNFSVGDGNPNYGYFNWTDYSNGYQYFVRYYWTGSNCSNSSECHIAREVTIVYPTPTPTGTVTPTPTATPTPTPTPTPTSLPTPEPTIIPTIYTYCDGGGTDKWAWGKTWTNMEWFTQGRPYSPTDFFNASTHTPPYTLSSGNSSIYSWVCANDSDNWRHLDTTPALEFGADTELYTIKIYQDKSSVTNLSVTWIGHGSTSGAVIYHTKLKIWNYNSGSWYTLVDVTSPGSYSFQRYQSNITTNPGYYIETGSGNVSILASADDDSMPATQGIYTDYIEIKVEE